tara:strand:+ start:287 stop:535 length:249 start_codon:yes stop_codon:yes gene_type:complete
MEDNNKKIHKPFPSTSNVLLSKLYYQYIPYFSELIIEEINKSSFNIHIDDNKKEEIIKRVLDKYDIIPDNLISSINKKLKQN